MSDLIDISKMNKTEVVARLANVAAMKELGKSLPSGMTYELAKIYVESGLDILFAGGRVTVNLDDDAVFDPTSFDAEYGEGAALKALTA